MVYICVVLNFGGLIWQNSLLDKWKVYDSSLSRYTVVDNCINAMKTKFYQKSSTDILQVNKERLLIGCLYLFTCLGVSAVWKI